MKSLFTPKWITDKFIWLMLGVYPLFVGTEGYAALTRSKFLFFGCATGLWLVLTVIAALVTGEKPRFGRTSLCCAVFALTAVISALLSPIRRFVWLGAGRYDGLASLLLYCAIFVGVSGYGERRRAYLAVFAASMAVCCGIGLLQLFGLDPFDLFPNGYTYYDTGLRYTGEFLGTVGNVDLLGALLAAAVPMLLFAYIGTGDRLTLPPAAFLLYVGLLSGVAALRLALVVGCAVSLPFLVRRGQGKRLLVALALVLVVVLASALTPLGLKGTDAAALASGDLAKLGSGRLEIWKKLLPMWRERPLLGGGPGTVAMRVGITWSRYVPQTGQTLSVFVDNAHNEYLGYLMDLGLTGLAAYLAMLASSAADFIRNRREPLAGAFAAGIVCYFVQSFFGLGLCIVLPILWMLWALACTDGKEEPLPHA